MSDPNKVVLIEWEDATYELDPTEVDLKPAILHTVGWIVREDDKVVILASEYNNGRAIGFRQALCLPRSLIHQITPLRRK